jgi:hypothetical protein
MDEAAIATELEHAFDENCVASDSERRGEKLNGEDILSEDAPDNEKSRTYYFGSLTITIGKIKEMEEKGYFTEDEARTPRSKLAAFEQRQRYGVRRFLYCQFVHAFVSYPS